MNIDYTGVDGVKSVGALLVQHADKVHNHIRFLDGIGNGLALQNVDAQEGVRGGCAHRAPKLF
jgi:hypothetical protein